MTTKPQNKKVKILGRKENVQKGELWKLKNLSLVRDVRGRMLKTIY